ncbi:MAG: Exoenzymes regulatory protein AepA in lipid-linked oligosaccharide synthesis cluster [uncultured Thermomicrobiales bacterium]|uniref:Exoenzymes regulatory protein AepA in lipid-linked oligosaccharide synthesis cluster n=1 Tax=uncultured Thermomicrobiales bacterium TaxID=1645740 RepID=A0A6J4V4U7_9BACT|nr:MAG: Exoenzymes regulatory protein AepA in lipid-linked oligosaccharide synthesis cluster [uncultured Thermomicrobiales bacterium]
MSGDLLLLNGRVLTMDPARPEASAVAIRQGRIVAVGGDAETRAAAGPDVETVDLRGRTATPGLNDAHAHPMGVGFALDDLDLGTPPNRSVVDLVALVAGEARRRAPGEWILGRGYDQARLTEGQHPTSHDLDPVAPDHPALLLRSCHHIGVANGRALALAGITRETPDPDGGRIDRDEHGEPTGVVREAALGLVQDAVGEPSEERIAVALERAGRAFLERGVTSTTEAGIDSPGQLAAYQRLHRDGRLPVRTYLMMMLDETLGPLAELGLRTGFGDDRLRIGPAKLFADGSIGARTARMRAPYVGETENVGLWMMPPEELRAKVLRAHRAGFQVGIHAIGDAAIDLVLDAYEAAMAADPRPDPRHRIEHCSIVDEGIVRRIAALGVIPVPGTSFLRHFRDAYVDNLGEERPRLAYGLANFARHGVRAAASSDAPVVPIDPLSGVQTMVTRRDVEGRPVWPDEAVGLDDALRAYTVNGAYASFEERTKGTLAPGMLGDVTVFETDLREVRPDELAAVAVDLTILDGRVAFARD